MVSKKYKLRLYSILGICELVLAGLKFGLPKKRSVVMQVSYIWSIRFFSWTFTRILVHSHFVGVVKLEPSRGLLCERMWRMVLIKITSLRLLAWCNWVGPLTKIIFFLLHSVCVTIQNELDCHASFPVCLAAFLPCFQENSARWWSLSFSDWRRAWIIGCGTSDAVHNETIN